MSGIAIARGRIPLTEQEFFTQLNRAGVNSDIARFVCEEAKDYYFEPLQPDPNDRWEGTMRIDPEDLEDITAKFWKQQGWMEPDPKDPVVRPSDPTLLEYALWLDQQRQVQK